MTSSFNLQDYRIPGVILQQILAKMEGKSLVRLCQTSTWGLDTVEWLQKAKLERYLAAKRDEDELLKLLTISPVDKDTLRYMWLQETHALEQFLSLNNAVAAFIPLGPFKNVVDKSRRFLELAEKTLNNWDLLH